MNPYQFSSVCDVCGQEGHTDTRGLRGMWEGATMRCINKAACAERAKYRNQRNEARIKQLELQLSARK